MARLPTTELWTDPRRAGLGRFGERWDLAALMVVLVFGAYLNAFGMITPVYALQARLAHWLNTTAETPGLLLIFVVGLLVIPAILLSVTAFASRWAAGRADPPGAVIRRFVYSLAPLGFGMWLAHYAFHFLTGALTIIPVAQSFLNDSGFMAGEPLWELGPIVPPDWLFPLQVILLYGGLFGSLVTAFQIAVNRHRLRHIALRAFLPWAVLHFFLLAAAVWIMFQPMEMRGTIFLGL
jgi:hypothetical protein